MKKTLLVSAVALAVSGNAMSAEMYGNIRLGLATYVPPTAAEPLGVDELDVRSGKLVLGSKGSTDLDNGQTFKYQLEMEHDRADTKGTGWANDKSWISIGGDWGTLSAGRFSDMAGFACGGTDLLTNGTAEACSIGHSTETDDAIGYRFSGGAFEFGVIVTADGTTADDDILYGAKFSGNNWSVGFQLWTDESGNGGSGSDKLQVGATWQLGNIGLGVTVVDSDDEDAGGVGVGDDGGVDFGLYMPLLGGNLAVVISSLDADTGIVGTVSDGDSWDVEWSNSLGGGAYWGIEINDKDNWDETRTQVYMGTNF